MIMNFRFMNVSGFVNERWSIENNDNKMHKNISQMCKPITA